MAAHPDGMPLYTGGGKRCFLPVMRVILNFKREGGHQARPVFDRRLHLTARWLPPGLVPAYITIFSSVQSPAARDRNMTDLTLFIVYFSFSPCARATNSSAWSQARSSTRDGMEWKITRNFATAGDRLHQPQHTSLSKPHRPNTKTPSKT